MIVPSPAVPDPGGRPEQGDPRGLVRPDTRTRVPRGMAAVRSLSSGRPSSGEESVSPS